MLFLLVVMPFLLAASPPAQSESPPEVLKRHIHNGTFDPGDYRWLRGQFEGASADDKADTSAIEAWRHRCRVRDLAQARGELAGMGVTVGPSLQSIPYRSVICSQVASLPEPLNLHDWDGFARDVAVVTPIAQGFFAAVTLAERAAEPRGAALVDQLNGRSIGEQVLRRGLDWANGDGADAPPAALTPQQRGILISEIAIALDVRDAANTRWLKDIVAAQGWPTRAKAGEAGAQIAWLLVQHADADPAFQLRAVLLMEPLVSAGEVDPKNYAYLYDRVMLKLVGKQRYASQMTCRAGHWVSQPLEDDGKVDLWRRQAGLVALADHLRQVNTDRGSCTEIPTDG